MNLNLKMEGKNMKQPLIKNYNELAGILGHTKASFTLDRYTHVTTDMQRQASGIVTYFITDMFGEELKPSVMNTRYVLSDKT